MNNKGKILLPVLIVLIIVSLSLAGGAFFLYQNEHALNIRLQGTVEEVNALKHTTEKKLEESQRKVADLELRLQESKTQIDSLTKELEKEKSTGLEVSNKLTQLNDDLEKQKSLREDLENRLSQAEVDGKQVKEQVKILEKQKVELEDKIKNLEAGSSGVELGKVVVNSETVVPVGAETGGKTKKAAVGPVKTEKKAVTSQVKSLEGKVMVVNKEFNFAVINLGSKDGVKLGDEFSVLSSGKSIGTIKVEKVHEAMSAAGFAEELKNKIKDNDTVAQKAK